MNKTKLSIEYLIKLIIKFQNIYSVHICFCLITATIGVILIYPFIGLADGFLRWDLAMEIIKYGRIETETLLSPIIPYIQAATYKLFNSYAFYTFMQAFIFYLTICILTRAILKEKKINIFNINFDLWKIVSICTILFPSVFIFPLMLTDSSPIFILLIFIFYLLKDYILCNKNVSFINLIMLSVLIALCIGIRINSIIVFLILIIYFIISNIIHKNFNVSYIFSVLIGIGLGLFIPFISVPHHYNASTLGMVWELVGLANNTKNEELIYELGKYGDINEALNRYGEPYLNSIIWDNKPPYNVYDISSKYSKKITKLYIKQTFNNTKAFIKNKMYFISNSMGLNNRLISSKRGIHWVDERTKHYGAIPTKRQFEIRGLFFIITDFIGIISLSPFLSILISIILAYLVGRNNKNSLRNLYYWIIIASAYYLSFLINTQAFEFRYFAPSFYILFIVDICCFILIFMKIKAK